ncbi:transmembrane protein, putative [Bodo saltans]|uniref:Transmembrane protein, putative n=1 Tax=Bodo saltans TaxID=75058 RepID=A0A0S4ITS1_BODSA|nr:transmembrane protein, putative [Bodo saltans]|eukprot:CUF87801.1 transmembrane protein, putative [Bodo saltans]
MKTTFFFFLKNVCHRESDQMTYYCDLYFVYGKKAEFDCSHLFVAATFTMNFATGGMAPFALSFCLDCALYRKSYRPLSCRPFSYILRASRQNYCNPAKKTKRER